MACDVDADLRDEAAVDLVGRLPPRSAAIAWATSFSPGRGGAAGLHVAAVATTAIVAAVVPAVAKKGVAVCSALTLETRLAATASSWLR